MSWEGFESAVGAIFNRGVDIYESNNLREIEEEKTEQLNLAADVLALRDQISEPEFDAQDINETTAEIVGFQPSVMWAVYGVGAVLVVLALRNA